jgi:phasin
MIDKAKHIAAAAEALALFQRSCGTVDAHAIADLICDLGLLADERGLDFLGEAKRGIGHWFAERFEVPSEVQAMMEQSVRQARMAMEAFTTATRNMVGSMEYALPSAAKELNSKAFSYAEANIKAACDFAEKLARAKDAQEVMQLQREFAKTQLEALQEQTKEIGVAVQGAVKGSGKTPGGQINE